LSAGSSSISWSSDWVDENNPVHVIEAFVEALDLVALGFVSATPAATGRPAYHPAVLLKLCIYGYLNRVQSSRRLEREAGRNILWVAAKNRRAIHAPVDGFAFVARRFDTATTQSRIESVTLEFDRTPGQRSALCWSLSATDPFSG